MLKPSQAEGASISEVTLIGIDLAERVFQLPGARSDGSVAFRTTLSQEQLFAFVSQQPTCLIAMEACAAAHGWGRTFEEVGHDVRLRPPDGHQQPFETDYLEVRRDGNIRLRQ